MPLNKHKPHLFKIGRYWLCRCDKGKVGISADVFRAYFNWMTRVKL